MNLNRYTIHGSPLLFLLIGILLPPASVSSGAAYNLAVDGSVTQRDVPHFWSECVGCGTAHLALRADVTSAYRIGHDECGFKRVRGHGLFNNLANENQTNLFHWNGNPSFKPNYTWTRFDGFMDSIKAAGMQPLVELSFMPKDLASDPSRSTCPPKNYDVWRDLIDSTVTHCVNRYGKAEVESWYWEVWNEPDFPGFWSGTPEEYFRLYKATVEGATRALSTIRIGGPATCNAGPELGATPKTAKIAEFLNFCKTNNLKVDFASCHQYGQGFGTTSDPLAMRLDNRERWDRIRPSGLTGIKSFNTEWNSSYSGQGGAASNPACVSMDSHANAPFVARAVKAVLDDHSSGTYPAPDVFSYWVISDIFDEADYYIQKHNEIPFAQVFGLMNYQGLRKATFNAFKMLHKMGNTRVSMSGGSGADIDGVDGFATLNAAKDSLCVIIYNHYKLIETSGTDDVTLTVDKAPFAAGTELTVSHFRVDQTHSNPYDVWKTQGSPPKPTADQWTALRAAQNLADIETQPAMTYQGGVITKSFTLPKQAVSLFVFASKNGSKIHEAVTAANAVVPVTGRGTKLFVAMPPDKTVRISLHDASGRRYACRTVRGGDAFDCRKVVASGGLYFARGEIRGATFTRTIIIP